MQNFERCPMIGAVTMLFGDDGMRLEVRDEASYQTFLYLEVRAEHIASMLSRLSSIPCKFGLHAPERVGLLQEHKSFEFPMPSADYKNRREIAIAACDAHIPEGWVADSSFNSQNTFFKRDGVEMARTTIRRWVPPPLP